MKHAFDFLIEKDEVLKGVINQYGLPKVQFRDQGFAAMCHIILEQQVSIASARATYQKLSAHLGEITPAKMLETSDEALRPAPSSFTGCIRLSGIASVVFLDILFSTQNKRIHNISHVCDAMQFYTFKFFEVMRCEHAA